MKRIAFLVLSLLLCFTVPVFTAPAEGANRLTTNPIIIDTTDQAIAGPIVITSMIWVSTEASAISQNDDLTIELGTGSGAVVFSIRNTKSSSTFNPVVMPFPGGWETPAIYIEDIDGGELHIFTKTR